MTPRFISMLLAAVLVAASTTPGISRQGAGDGTVAVQLLAFNDFHGNLDPPAGTNGRIGGIGTDAGGVEYLATHLRQLEARNPNTLIVSAGDVIGASPLLSGLFHDEPTIEAMNAAGLDVSSVGNHEFDEGWAELVRMQHGGCHPVDGCQDHTPFAGAAFQYLSANVILDPRKVDKAMLAESGLRLADRRPVPLLPAYVVKDIGGVRIGFIGMTLRGTPQLVQPNGVKGLTFKSESETVNKIVPVLKRQGVRAIVVLIHEGGIPTGDEFNGCTGVAQAIAPIANGMSDEVDLVISGHTHRPYICTMGSKLVTSAASFGRLITVIDLRIDKSTNEIVSKTAHNVIVTRDVPKDPAQTAILERYRPLYSGVASRTVGSIAADITGARYADGESALGNVAADAILAATKDAAAGSAVLALMNPGGIRADLVRSRVTDAGPSDVSYADIYTVHPFQNRLVVKTLTGEQLRKILEQQFDNRATGSDIVLQVSDGFRYSYDRSQPPGKRVDPRSMTLAGRPIAPRQKYRVGTTEFLSDGGDNFTVFAEGTDLVYNGLDVDALAAYLAAHSPLSPGALNRITRLK